MVRRFNEDEAVWRRFQNKRLERDAASLIPDDLLDEIDWREAEQKVRVTRCIGKPLTPESWHLLSFCLGSTLGAF